MTSVNFLRLPSHGRLAAWRARPSHPAAGRQGRAAASRSSRPAAAQRATEVLAHDLNNLLAVILAANEVLALDLPVGSYNHELAQVGQGAAERAALLLARWPGRSGPRRPVGIASDAGEAIRLTAREFALLELLARHPGQLFNRERLIDALWGADFAAESNIVEVYIRSLRRKVDDGRRDGLIETVRGAGYRLRAPDSPERTSRGRP